VETRSGPFGQAPSCFIVPLGPIPPSAPNYDGLETPLVRPDSDRLSVNQCIEIVKKNRQRMVEPLVALVRYCTTI